MNRVMSFNEQYDLFCQKFSKDHIVLKFNEREVHKEAFEAQVTYFITKLIDLGVRKGIGVGCTMPNSVEMIPLFIAISKLGAYAVPLIHLMPQKTQVTYYKNAQVKFVITTAQQLAGLIDASKEQEALYTLATIDSNRMGVYSFTEPLYKKIDIQQYILKETPLDLPLMAVFSKEIASYEVVYIYQSNAMKEMKTLSLSEENRTLKCCIGYQFCTPMICSLIGMLLNGMMLIYSDEIDAQQFIKLIETYHPEQIIAPVDYFKMLLQKQEREADYLRSVQCISMEENMHSFKLVANFSR